MLRGMPSACLTRFTKQLQVEARPSDRKHQASINSEVGGYGCRGSKPRCRGQCELKAHTPPLSCSASQVGLPQKPQLRPAGFDCTPIAIITGDAATLLASRSKLGRFSKRAISLHLLSAKASLPILVIDSHYLDIVNAASLGSRSGCGCHQARQRTRQPAFRVQRILSFFFSSFTVSSTILRSSEVYHETLLTEVPRV